MKVLTIIIVVWSFYTHTNFVQPTKEFIQPTTTLEHTSINCEAILQNDDNKILFSEEITKLSIELMLILDPPNNRNCDKERPATGVGGQGG